MTDKLSLSDYDKFRKSENVSVEIKENDNTEEYKLFLNTLKKTPSNKNIFNDIHKLIYEENQEGNQDEKDKKIVRLSHLLTVQEIKQNSLKIINTNLLCYNNKLKYEIVLKDILLKRSSSRKDYINNKLEKYHFGYKVWKNLLGERYEDLSLIE